MNNEIYPIYLDLLKLRKAHSIFEIASLVLGIDPRLLKIKPQFHEQKGCFVYEPEAQTFRYLPIKAESMKLEEYLAEEKNNHVYVPLENIGEELGHYQSGMGDILYQELKRTLLTAAIEDEIESIIPGTLDKELWLSRITENTLVKAASVKKWLDAHNFCTPFFERPLRRDGLPEYLDRNHPEYSPELAIAVEAWSRFSNMGISHPKKYIEKWLNESFSDENNLSEDSVHVVVTQKAKDRIATLVNWNSDGGVNTKAFSIDVYKEALQKNFSQKTT